MVARVFPVTTLPLSDLDEEVSKVVERLEKDGGHVVFTRDGAPTAVLMSSERFDALTHRDKVVTAIEEAMADIEAGRVYTTAEVKAELERRFGPIPWE